MSAAKCNIRSSIWCDKSRKLLQPPQKIPAGVLIGGRQGRWGGGRAAAARAGQWGPRRVDRPGGGRRARRSGEGCPERSGGSARVKRRPRPPWWRVSTSEAKAAPAVVEGQHESSEGCARRGGGSARVGRRPRPPWWRVSRKGRFRSYKKSPQAFTRGDILQIT